MLKSELVKLLEDTPDDQELVFYDARINDLMDIDINSGELIKEFYNDSIRDILEDLEGGSKTDEEFYAWLKERQDKTNWKLLIEGFDKKKPYYDREVKPVTVIAVLPRNKKNLV